MQDHQPKRTPRPNTLAWLGVLTLACVGLAWPSHARAQAIDLPDELTNIRPGPATPAKPAPAPGAAQPGQPKAAIDAGQTGLDPRRVPALWNQHWRLYAAKFIPVGNDYAACAHYDIRYPSSQGVTSSQLTREMTEKKKVRTGLFTKTYTIKPDGDDVAAYARALPEVAVGEYGYIHSAKVLKVLGPDAMVIGDIWLVDAKAVTDAKKKELEKYPEPQRPRSTSRSRSRSSSRSRTSDAQRDRERRADDVYRQAERLHEAITDRIEENFELREKLIKQQSSSTFEQPLIVRGVNTASVRAGMRWEGTRRGQGVQIAVVMKEPKATDSSRSSRSSRSRSSKQLVAVPGNLLRRAGLKEEQFLDALAKRDMTAADFVELVVQVKRTTKADPNRPYRWEPGVFDELESRRGQGEPGAVAQAPVDKGPTKPTKASAPPPPAGINFPLPKSLETPAAP